MTTVEQRDALRFDTGSDATVLTDALIDALYVRAAAVYPTPEGAQEAWVRVLVINGLMAQAAKRTDYKQNESQEWMSQLMTNLEKLKKGFLAELDVALAGEFGLVRWGALRRVTPRLVEAPDDVELANLLGGTLVSGDVSRIEI